MVLEADLRQFFPSIRMEQLEAVLGAFAPPHEAEHVRGLLERVDQVLGHPLPEGYAASRALANLCLLEVDRAIHLPFTRWIDDYRIFVSTEEEARRCERRLREAVSRVGFELNEKKVRIRESRRASNADASLGAHCDDDVTLADALEMLNGGSDAQRGERLTRFALRLATERADASALEHLVRVGPSSLPAVLMPRLAPLLVRVGWGRTAAAITEELLSTHDRYSEWRMLRLAYALWYAPSGFVGPHLDEMIQLAATSRPVRDVVARVVARHQSERLRDLVWDENVWAGRRVRKNAELERVTATDQADAPDQVRSGPPIDSFL